MTLEEFNQLTKESAAQVIRSCCGVDAWLNALIEGRPYSDLDILIQCSDKIWNQLSDEQKAKAFLHHPRIGQPPKDDSQHSRMAKTEQSGVLTADEQIKNRLRDGNVNYEKRFGHIFLICATGLSASMMLSELERRLMNDPKTELQIAFQELNKITQIRLRKVFQ